MRILWFSVTPSLFTTSTIGYNGGGWIASLEQIVRKEKSVHLGVAFEFSDVQFRYDSEGVVYYPIKYPKFSVFDKLRGKSNKQEKIALYLKIIKDFKPDLIQIFGSENDFGLICQHTDIPIVIHIQGCIPPYYNALFPIGMNHYDFYFQRGLDVHYRFIGLRSEPTFRKRAKQEVQIIQSCRYFMGRTAWDKGLIELFNPEAHYFHCEEALRDSFLKGMKTWEYSKNLKKIFATVISRPWYKGVDLILKTARLLTQFTDLDFEWQVYGVQDIRFYEAKYGIRAQDVGVKIMGVVTKDELVDALCRSSCYIHPSYIDNSPNSLCEAQILGVPVLATHVGGISSLVEDGESGLLFPANDPFTLASLIKRLTGDEQLSKKLGGAARKQALSRHNPEKIRHTLLDIYQQILSNKR